MLKRKENSYNMKKDIFITVEDIFFEWVHIDVSISMCSALVFYD